jgi:hypothetical protein
MSKGLLSGWKSIAAFCDCSPSTAKRWSQRHGLPVRDGPSGPIADAAEISEWARTAFPKKHKEG